MCQNKTKVKYTITEKRFVRNFFRTKLLKRNTAIFCEPWVEPGVKTTHRCMPFIQGMTDVVAQEWGKRSVIEMMLCI